MQLPAMRDSVYEVKSPCLAVLCNTDVITLIFNCGFNQILFEYLLFEIALTSEKIIIASLGGQSILKNQKFATQLVTWKNFLVKIFRARKKLLLAMRSSGLRKDSTCKYLLLRNF